MTDLVDIKAAAKLLETSVLRLVHVIDVGDLVPSVMPNVGARDDVLLRPSVSAIRFSQDDLDRFRAEVRRRDLIDFKAAYADVLEPWDGPGSRDLEVPPGWIGLLEDYCDQLRTLRSGDQPVKLRWGKEKFGYLILYCTDDHLASTRLQTHWLDILDERTRRLSLRTCQECGQPGRLRWGAHAATLCEQHKHIVGGLRAEDGVILDPQRDRVDGVEVLRPWQRSDAFLGISKSKTYDFRKRFAVNFDPMLDASTYIEDSDEAIARLQEKLIAVDKAIGYNREIVFKIMRFDSDAIEYDVKIEPRQHDLVMSLINEERVEHIKSEIDRIMNER